MRCDVLRQCSNGLDEQNCCEFNRFINYSNLFLLHFWIVLWFSLLLNQRLMVCGMLSRKFYCCTHIMYGFCIFLFDQVGGAHLHFTKFCCCVNVIKTDFRGNVRIFIWLKQQYFAKYP